MIPIHALWKRRTGYASRKMPSTKVASMTHGTCR
jgi:hypothetical protein